jgi:hypothetical protein
MTTGRMVVDVGLVVIVGSFSVRDVSQMSQQVGVWLKGMVCLGLVMGSAMLPSSSQRAGRIHLKLESV